MRSHDLRDAREGIRFLTFDCYGTLVDWETGILEAIRPLLAAHGTPPDDIEIIRRYAALEAEAEDGPWRPYREVLGDVVEGLLADLGAEPSAEERSTLARSLGRWPVFDDTVPSLRRLRKRFRLAIVSNVDDDLFAATASRLEVPFHAVVTAERAGAYKPDPSPFLHALDRLDAGRHELLHVAQSAYHDHVPARELGIRSVRVDRPSRIPGVGVTPDVDVRPDWSVGSLAELCDRLGV